MPGMTFLSRPSFDGTINTRIERVQLTDGVLLRAGYSSNSLDVCQDRCGIVCDESGRVKHFALADGVGSCKFGGQAAQVAVDEALRLLSVPSLNASTQERVDHFPENIQVMIAAAYAKRIRPHALGRLRALSLTEKDRGTFEAALDEHGDGATTLIAGSIEGNTLHVACVADGGVIVLDQQGNVKAISNKTEAQFNFSHQQIDIVSGAAVRPATLDHEELSRASFQNTFSVELEEGDMVFAFSDGLLKISSNKRNPDGTYFYDADGKQVCIDPSHALAQNLSRFLRGGRW